MPSPRPAPPQAVRFPYAHTPSIVNRLQEIAYGSLPSEEDYMASQKAKWIPPKGPVIDPNQPHGGKGDPLKPVVVEPAQKGYWELPPDQFHVDVDDKQPFPLYGELELCWGS